MNYQSSGSYHTLTHWQSGKTRRKWPEYTGDDSSRLIPPMLINGNIALFPYGCRVKGYEYFTTGEDYSYELKDYQVTNYLTEGDQKIPVKPVYGEICKADWTLFGTTDHYYYVCIYYSPLKLDIEPLPLYYKRWTIRSDEETPAPVRAECYETDKLHGEINNKEITVWAKNDKKHELYIDKDYTGTAIIPEIECRMDMTTRYYNNIDKIPEWQRKFCKDRTDITYQASPPDEIPEVTERVLKEVKKKHPEYFKYPLKLEDYGTPLYFVSGTNTPYEGPFRLGIRYLECDDEETTYLNRANNIGTSYNYDDYQCTQWDGEEYASIDIYGYPPKRVYGAASEIQGNFLVGEVDDERKVTGNRIGNGFTLMDRGSPNDLHTAEYVVTGLKIVNNFKFFEERSEDNGKN